MGIDELTLTGRITAAPFLGRIDGAALVYKPIAGEMSRWDCPIAVGLGRQLADLQGGSGLRALECPWCGGRYSKEIMARAPNLSPIR